MPAQEEDRIIVIETGKLKEKLSDRTLTGKRLKEFLIRLVYVEMLGHDASFGYMKSVEASARAARGRSLGGRRARYLPLRRAPAPHSQLCASSNLLEKRVAYMCAGLCFAPTNEFRMMLVNRLQRDLQNANVLEVSVALIATSKLITADMIPAVLPIVSELLKHDQEIVRKKAVMVLHRFYQLATDSVSHMGDKFRRALCHKDPSVMGASLHLFHELVKVDPVREWLTTKNGYANRRAAHTGLCCAFRPPRSQRTRTWSHPSSPS